MKNLKFPQVENIPSSIKEKVMEHVFLDMKQKWSIVKKAKISIILVPTFIMLLLFIGIFSLIYTSFGSNKQNDSWELLKLEQKIVDIENILDELENI